MSNGRNAYQVDFWKKIRVLLRDKGIVVDTSYLAQFFQDDNHILFGIIVTSERRVFEFDFNWLHNPEGVFSIWRETTEIYLARPWKQYVALTLQVQDADKKR